MGGKLVPIQADSLTRGGRIGSSVITHSTESLQLYLKSRNILKYPGASGAGRHELTHHHHHHHHQSVFPSSSTAPVRLLIMSDLDSLLVELESSIERRVTSSSTTCTRLTLETECEEISSVTRQQPRSDSQH